MPKDFVMPAWLTREVIQHLREFVLKRDSRWIPGEGFLCSGYDSAFDAGLVSEHRKSCEGDGPKRMPALLRSLELQDGAYVFEYDHLPTWFVREAHRAGLDMFNDKPRQLNARRLLLLDLLEAELDG